MARRRAFAGLLTAAALVGCNACDKSPTSPTPALAVAQITIAGPATLAPGGTAQFTAIARHSNGATSDVTARASWHSTSAEIVEVNTGTAVARARGEARIWAQIGGTGSPSVHVAVLENGTFVLTGRVTDSANGQTVPRAVIEVVNGIGSGLRATTSPNGSYVLYGVAGQVRLSASSDGFATQTEDVTVTGTTARDIVLTPLAPLANLTGIWTLTVSAPHCGQLPVEARSRQFEASIRQSGSQLNVTLSSLSLYWSEVLRGQLLATTMIVPVPHDPSNSIDNEPYYALLDGIGPSARLGIRGTISATVNGNTVDGLLDGGLDYYSGAVTFGAAVPCTGASVSLRSS